ncbi:MAG TPA: hypothetical protein VFU08_01935 [Candidatus Udaeobacter sp.]|nr:hypothetical protein [Candidatus Udaeobacter sp.]
MKSIKSSAHPEGTEDNYTRIAIFAKIVAQLFLSVLFVTATGTISLDSIRNAAQAAHGFSAKGQMMWELRRPAYWFGVIRITN